MSGVADSPHGESQKRQLERCGVALTVVYANSGGHLAHKYPAIARLPSVCGILYELYDLLGVLVGYYDFYLKPESTEGHRWTA